MTINRRDLLKGAAVGTATLALGACSDGADPAGAPDAGDPPLNNSPDAQAIVPPDSVPEVAGFELGVSAGDLAGDRGVLWTKYTGSAALAAVAWRVEGQSHIEQLGPFTATPSDAGFVHVQLTGLVPGARYRYSFFELGSDGTTRAGRSLIGKFRAPIADDAMEPVTLGAICCISNTKSPDPIQRAADDGEFDAFLFLGDTEYCETERLDGYR
ncbi:MAG: PhoD-like phosphatase N-terminal domain-containing protein, partial [Kofleriaceae bacterium]